MSGAWSGHLQCFLCVIRGLLSVVLVTCYVRWTRAKPCGFIWPWSQPGGVLPWPALVQPMHRALQVHPPFSDRGLGSREQDASRCPQSQCSARPRSLSQGSVRMGVG